MSLAEFEHLWDGTELGWTIQRTWHNQCDVYVVFDREPTVSDVARLRTLLDEYRELSATEAWSRLAGAARVLVGLRPLTEARQLAARGSDLGLTIELVDRSAMSYTPFNELTSMMILIEDDDVARRVGEEAIARGVKASDIEVD